jgi:hypothetical protein
MGGIRWGRDEDLRKSAFIFPLIKCIAIRTMLEREQGKTKTLL